VSETIKNKGRPKGARGKNILNLVGNVYGMLTVIEQDTEYYISPGGSEKSKWICSCECGGTVSTTGGNLKSGDVWNCGCKKLTSKYPWGSYEYNRDRNLFNKYGLTLEQWVELFKSQGEVCAICGTDKKRGHNWHTDHCHTTGKVRGILCGWCNTGIGKLQENPEIFRKALEYLEESK
jgi:Recombination endonuclease VII.